MRAIRLTPFARRLTAVADKDLLWRLSRRLSHLEVAGYLSGCAVRPCMVSTLMVPGSPAVRATPPTRAPSTWCATFAMLLNFRKPAVHLKTVSGLLGKTGAEIDRLEAVFVQ